MSGLTPLPVPTSARFQMDGFHVWCGTMARTPDGVFHLLFSRWPVANGFESWVTHSEVCHATGGHPFGPFTFRGVALAGAGGDAWDASVTHNPTLLAVGGRYYCYYTGNRGDRRDWWEHRNSQRVGVAVAGHPAGPWRRFDRPLVDVTPGDFDHLITSNPAVTRAPDGRFLMMYKTVADGTPPFGGKVRHAVAWSNDPLGPFVKHPRPVLEHPTATFPAEDPFVWADGDRFHAVVKDMGGHFTGTAGPSLARFRSANGTDWSPADRPLVSDRAIAWADGTIQPVHRLERPQLWLDDAGRPATLLCAVLPSPDGVAFNVRIPLAGPA